MKALSSARKTSRRRKIIITVVIALILAGAGIYAVYALNKKSEDKNAADPTNHSAKHKTADDADSQDKSASNANSSGSGLPDNSDSKTSEQVPANTALSVSITSASQSGGMVKADAQTNGGGTCVFLYQPADGGKPVTRQVAVNNNSCAVSISQNEFAYLGQWKLTVTYYENNGKAEVSQNVTIN